MVLHPEVKRYLESVRASGAPRSYTLTPAEAREMALRRRALTGPGPAVASVRDVAIPTDDREVPARIYDPEEDAGGVLVYFHGGGWVLGDLDGSDAMCRRLALASGCVVVSVAYRLAPEHPYPAAVEDADAAVQWIASNMSHPAGLMVVGDSAGGNLAAVCAVRARDRGGPALALQVLVYPVTDHVFTTPSYERYADAGLPLGRHEMEWFWDLYAPAHRRAEPEASPLRTPQLVGVPPALILVAGFDPLYSEAVAYADSLKRSGVPVEIVHFVDMPHGFFPMVNVFTRADEAVALVGERVRCALAAR
jgi:acetyl esterase